MPISISGDGPITGITSLNTTVSSTELGYLDGTTSTIQTQINSKPTGGSGAWTAYTPTFTGLTLGNGSLINCTYVQIGKTVHCKVGFIFGSTSSFTSVVDFSLPVTALALQGNPNMGVARYIKSGGSQYNGVMVYISTGAVRFQRSYVSGSEILAGEIGSGSPFTWAANDQMHGIITYEAA